MGIEATIGSLSLKTVQSDWERNWQWKWTDWLEPHQGSLKNRGPRPLFSGGPNEVHGPCEFSHWSPRSELSNPTRKPLLLSSPPHALVLNGGLKKKKNTLHVSEKKNKEIPPHLSHLQVIHVPLRLSRHTVQLPHPAGHLSWCNRFIR